MRIRSALLILFPALGGCFGFYIPDPSRGDTRGAIVNKDLARFSLKQSTREEIVLALGEPEYQSDDGTAFLYWWYGFRGFLLFVLAAPAGGGKVVAGMIGSRTNLCFKCDEQGRVVRSKFVGGLENATPAQLNEILAQW